MLTTCDWSVPGAMLRVSLSRAPTKAWMQQLVSANLVKSSTRTLASNPNPQNLPKQPLPKLQATLEKYLQTLTPLLSNEEHAVTTKLVKEFECSATADTLQKYLEQRAKCKLNWLEEWWLNTAYLGFRYPVVVHSSPGQSIPFETFESEDDRLTYTSKLILAALSYKMIIDEKKMPVDKMGKFELDMEQYNKIFGTCRMPKKPIDFLCYNRNSKHIIIMHKNHFFRLNVLHNDKPLSQKQIFDHLKCVITQSSEKTVPIGVLTSDDRDNWTKFYEDLCTGNEKSLTDVQQSLFLVCLDDAMPGVDSDYPNKQTKGGYQLIHGGGSCANSGNRWFDKTVQFIIGCDGILGLTYEHSPSEGQPIAYMVDFLYNFIKKDSGTAIPDNTTNEGPTKLCFEISDATTKNIEKAESNIDQLVANFDLRCFKFEGYGKDFIKQQKLSPDSYIQMAMQYAFYKMNGFPAAHYESAATRKYVGGRTETIRSCSAESLAFAKTMLDKCKSDEEKVAALKAAIDAHKKYAVQALEGHGVDRHLLGLRLAARELGSDLPALFSDVGFTRSTNFLLSTSQVATKCDAVMGYGPTSPEGYGCCYNPREHDINFAVSRFTDCPKTNVEQFENCMTQCLCDMQRVLTKAQKSKL
ncbi:hypothetical protein PPYR_08504 [Photinus pyralis]|uniref:Choline/carnitine acyltransferase domain-containing protein n=1 Tax=Photinus pyralis TaxID=7054 RepID=A0A1Y1N7M4_PHOPY|nr:carnitine O-acetyltransferase-like isoform X2 [Photinus pyralis]KAB0797511.1 hypothetical protein PPYR_08504 [Photinus pyralis]